MDHIIHGLCDWLLWLSVTFLWESVLPGYPASDEGPQKVWTAYHMRNSWWNLVLAAAEITGRSDSSFQIMEWGGWPTVKDATGGKLRTLGVRLAYDGRWPFPRLNSLILPSSHQYKKGLKIKSLLRLKFNETSPIWVSTVLLIKLILGLYSAGLKMRMSKACLFVCFLRMNKAFVSLNPLWFLWGFNN